MRVPAFVTGQALQPWWRTASNWHITPRAERHCRYWDIVTTTCKTSNLQHPRTSVALDAFPRACEGARCRSYETLARLFPEVEEYRVYHSQSLFKAGACTVPTRCNFRTHGSVGTECRLRERDRETERKMSCEGGREERATL